MNFLQCKQNANYLRLCFILALFLTFSATAYSQEKPLGTIGEPQLNKPATPIASPFSSDDEVMEKQKDTTAEENTNNQHVETDVSSPFNMDTTEEQVQQPELAQPEQTGPVVEDLKVTEAQTQQQSLIADPKNILGLGYPYHQLEKSTELLKKNDISGAKRIVEPLSEWLTELTEYHIQLFKKLNNIDTAKNQAQVEKRLALDCALLRDKAYYQLALVYYAENDLKKAVKYFVEVIKSQPKTETGMKSYEILQQIGFTEKIRLVP
jgi:tetratricopeptide (TPR) repeat protein